MIVTSTSKLGWYWTIELSNSTSGMPECLLDCLLCPSIAFVTIIKVKKNNLTCQGLGPSEGQES